MEEKKITLKWGFCTFHEVGYRVELVVGDEGEYRDYRVEATCGCQGSERVGEIDVDRMGHVDRSLALLLIQHSHTLVREEIAERQETLRLMMEELLAMSYE